MRYKLLGKSGLRVSEVCLGTMTFGGVGFLPHGNMLVGVWKDSLIARLGPDNHDDALLEPHVREFDITGRPRKGWVLVGPEGVQDDEQLSAWIGRAVKFVGALPAKEK